MPLRNRTLNNSKDPFLFNGDKLKNWKNALGNLSSILNVNIIGTSITEGSSANNVLSTSFAGILRNNVASKFGDVGYGIIPFYYPTSNSSLLWTYTGTWTPWNSAGFYNQANKGAPGSTATITFSGTEINILLGGGGGGTMAECTFSVSIDGGTATNFTNGYGNIVVKTITGLSDTTHTAVITNTHATKYLLLEGVLVSKGTKGIRVNTIGKQGGTAEYHATSTSIEPEITHWNPKLTIIECLSNDFNTQVTLANYKTRIQTLITAGLLSGDVLLTTIGANSNTKTIPITSYIDVLYQLARENNIALYDEFKQNSLTNLSDNTHPNTTRHNIIGNTLSKILGIS